MNKQKKIKKVVLVYPNQRWFKYDLTTTWDLSPYGICMLATMLKDRYDVEIVDAQIENMSKEEFRSKIENAKPDCVGISVLTSEYASILDTAAGIVKEIDKDITVVAGGVHVTTQYFRVIKNLDIDYAVRGEGERTLPALLDYLNGKRAIPEKGLVYRDEKGEMVALEPDRIEDMDSLPLPDYDLVDYSMYINTKLRYGVDSLNVFPHSRIMTSRGCPVGCCFCQVKTISGSKWRMRSAENVVNEISYLKEKYGIKGFYIEDDNAFVHKERTKTMLRMIRDRELNLQWKAAGVPIFKMDEETFELMAATGCQMIGVAIESGNQRILKDVIQKPVDLEKVPGLIATAKSYGIFVVANFIIGFPGETWAEVRNTLHFAETCGADYCKIYAAQPLVGTRLYDIAKETGCLVGEDTDVDWRYGRISTSEFTPKDISILRCYEWDRINFRAPGKREKTAAIMGITVDELDDIRKKTRNNLQS